MSCEGHRLACLQAVLAAHPDKGLTEHEAERIYQEHKRAHPSATYEAVTAGLQAGMRLEASTGAPAEEEEMDGIFSDIATSLQNLAGRVNADDQPLIEAARSLWLVLPDGGEDSLWYENEAESTQQELEELMTDLAQPHTSAERQAIARRILAALPSPGWSGWEDVGQARQIEDNVDRLKESFSVTADLAAPRASAPELRPLSRQEHDESLRQAMTVLEEAADRSSWKWSAEELPTGGFDVNLETPVVVQTDAGEVVVRLNGWTVDEDDLPGLANADEAIAFIIQKLHEGGGAARTGATVTRLTDTRAPTGERQALLEFFQAGEPRAEGQVTDVDWDEAGGEAWVHFASGQTVSYSAAELESFGVARCPNCGQFIGQDSHTCAARAVAGADDDDDDIEPRLLSAAERNELAGLLHATTRDTGSYSVADLSRRSALEAKAGEAELTNIWQEAGLDDDGNYVGGDDGESDSLAQLAQLDTETEQAQALAKLAPQLTEAERDTALGFMATWSNSAQVRGLKGLAPHLSEFQRNTVVRMVQAMSSHTSQADTLAAYAPHFSAPQRFQALTLAGEIQDSFLRGFALQKLAPYLSPGQRNRALKMAATLKPGDKRATLKALQAKPAPKPKVTPKAKPAPKKAAPKKGKK